MQKNSFSNTIPPMGFSQVKYGFNLLFKKKKKKKKSGTISKS